MKKNLCPLTHRKWHITSQESNLRHGSNRRYQHTMFAVSHWVVTFWVFQIFFFAIQGVQCVTVPLNAAF